MAYDGDFNPVTSQKMPRFAGHIQEYHRRTDPAPFTVQPFSKVGYFRLNPPIVDFCNPFGVSEIPSQFVHPHLIALV